MYLKFLKFHRLTSDVVRQCQWLPANIRSRRNTLDHPWQRGFSVPGHIRLFGTDRLHFIVWHADGDLKLLYYKRVQNYRKRWADYLRRTEIVWRMALLQTTFTKVMHIPPKYVFHHNFKIIIVQNTRYQKCRKVYSTNYQTIQKWWLNIYWFLTKSD